MKYYVTDGLRFIKQDSKLTLNRFEAGHWKQDKAEKVCKATRQSKYKRKYVWFLVSDEEIDKPIIENIYDTPFDLFITSNPTVYDIYQYSAMFNKKLKEISDIITDLYHIIELSEADNEEKLKRYDKLQNALKQRRTIKDNLTMLFELFTKDKDFDEVEKHLLHRIYSFRSERYRNINGGFLQICKNTTEHFTQSK